MKTQDRRNEVMAAESMDWQQVVLNGGPPCFHYEDGRFCGRAERWEGHDCIHEFRSLGRMLEEHGKCS